MFLNTLGSAVLRERISTPSKPGSFNRLSAHALSDSRIAKIPHPNGGTSRSSKSAGSENDFVFVNNIRFWAMVSIIAVHCLYAWGLVGSGATSKLQIALVQFAKFGTIAFYFISGFLLGSKIETCSPVAYLTRRIRSTARPWAVWACIFGGLPILEALLGGWMPHPRSVIVFWLYRNAKDVVFHSPYWFVPNFLFSLGILLVFRRHLDSLRLGAAFLLLSLFYGVNAYKRWVPSPHTAAIFGFIFYQWLGVWAARNSSLIFRALRRMTWGSVAGLVFGTGMLALGESYFMIGHRIPPIEAMNTLRITNQLFSLAVVIALFKLSGPTWPSFVDVRANTYGLYLTHPIAVWGIVELIRHVYRLAAGRGALGLEASANPIWANPFASLIVWMALFVVAYSLSLVATRIVAGSAKLSWMINPVTTRRRVARRDIATTGVYESRPQLATHETPRPAGRLSPESA